MGGGYLLLKEHGVDGLPAGQDHHGEPYGHRHHEAHADHLRHQVGGEVHQHVARDVLRETDVAEESHLVSEGRRRPQRRTVKTTAQKAPRDGRAATYGDVEDGDHVEAGGEDGAHALDGGLVQAVVGRQHLPATEKQPNKHTLGVLRDTNPEVTVCLLID